MPYIKQEKRKVLDPAIEQIRQRLVELSLDDENDCIEGNLNYIFTKILMTVYGDRRGTRYIHINDAVGVLECTKLEFYRKVAGPYEDQKEFDNGNIVSNIEPTLTEEIVVEKKE